MPRRPLLTTALLVSAGLFGMTGCTISVPSPEASGSASPTLPNSGAPAPEPTVAASPATDPGDLADPCTLLSGEQINTVLGTEFAEGQSSDDTARQISTCKYTSDDMTQIVAVTVSNIDGQKSYRLNEQLAESYFSGKPEPVDVPGADRAYLVIAETFNAPVIGMLVRGHFLLVQVGVEGATPQNGVALAAQTAAKVPS